MRHEQDQDWMGISLSGIDMREAVAEAIRTGEPVNVHVFPQGPELPVGATPTLMLIASTSHTIGTDLQSAQW